MTRTRLITKQCDGCGATFHAPRWRKFCINCDPDDSVPFLWLAALMVGSLLAWFVPWYG